MMNTSRKLHVTKADLQLIPTLGGGQSFRWRNTEPDNWIGVFRNKVWILSQTDNYITYQSLAKSIKEEEDENLKSTVTKDEKLNSTGKEDENMLKSYFRLDVDLNYYYKKWSERDIYFRKAAPKLYGIRILNQEVTENIFSFICSSNNNIKRISSMIDKLCEFYGEPITEVDGKMYFSFPTVERLTGSTVESDLRQAGFGYRAKFIYESACKIEKFGGSAWLENLKLLPYVEAKKELMKLTGIGAKVADCICLMSLGHMEAIPVDTHIFQVATSMYLPHLKKSKSLTDKVYNEIADHFRTLHGDYAGWANTVLAKKGSSEEKDSHENFNSWPFARPGHKHGPKHQRPWMQSQVYVANRPQQPPQGISTVDMKNFLENISGQMQQVSIRAYSEFQMVDSQIDRNKKNLENSLYNQLQGIESLMASKEAREIQQAVKQGKDEKKIQDCLKEEEPDFKIEMKGDVQRTMNCVNDATERARQIITEARNTFTENSVIVAMQYKNWAFQLSSCVYRNDVYCTQQLVSTITEKAGNIVEEANRQVEKLQEAPRQQMIQLDYCQQNFLQDMRGMRLEYTNLIKECVSKTSAEKSEEEDSEEDSDEEEIGLQVKAKKD